MNCSLLFGACDYSFRLCFSQGFRRVNFGLKAYVDTSSFKEYRCHLSIRLVNPGSEGSYSECVDHSLGTASLDRYLQMNFILVLSYMILVETLPLFAAVLILQATSRKFFSAALLGADTDFPTHTCQSCGTLSTRLFLRQLDFSLRIIMCWGSPPLMN